MKMKNVLIVGLVALLSISFAEAQVAEFFNALSTGGVFPKSDTVTNAGTGTVQCRLLRAVAVTNTTVQVNVTKISGTVGGTISLQGSLDGVNWRALNTVDTQTALATITAADATASYHWRLAGSPFLYYRVSWTGTGTMSASFTALLYRNKQ
jgi:hypothetical protein